MSISGYEALLQQHCKLAGLPLPEREIRFAPPRRWRFDLGWTDRKLAVEVEGAIWTRGRHTRGSGYEKDMEKYNAAIIAGWRVLRVSTGMVKDGRALTVIEQALKS